MRRKNSTFQQVFTSENLFFSSLFSTSLDQNQSSSYKLLDLLKESQNFKFKISEIEQGMNEKKTHFIDQVQKQHFEKVSSFLFQTRENIDQIQPIIPQALQIN